MQNHRNLYVIGTSHIAVESIMEVENEILKIKPEAVALELDKQRLLALLSRKKHRFKPSDIFRLGIKGFIFNLLGYWIERKLGKLVGTTPGSEMKRAFETAEKTNSKIYLIDQNIAITIRRLSKTVSLKEKIKFLADILFSFSKKSRIKFDLRKVPSEKVIRELTLKLKERYPSFYKVLIDERNKVMSKRLYKLMQTHKDVLAVVGAGHTLDIISLIKKMHQND